MRKVLSIILILVLCFCVGTACTNPNEHIHDYKTLKLDASSHWYECDCGEDKDCEIHSYTNGVCSCGYEIPHEHSYSILVKDNVSHWFECECGFYKEKTPHNLINEFCICGYNIHEHTYFKNFSYNAIYHWHVATCCEGVTSEKEKHFPVEGIVDANGNMVYQCAYCPATFVANDKWYVDDESHWKVSVDSDDMILFKRDHEWVDSGLVMPSGEILYTCEVCNYFYIETNEHSYSKAYNYDELYHWKKATCCEGVISIKVKHTWVEGIVDGNGNMIYQCSKCPATKR